MKKVLKKAGMIFVGLMVIEIMTLTYINNYYLKRDLDIESIKVNSVKVYKKEEIYTLLEKATNIRLSDTREYLSYFSNNKLKVVNLKDKTEKEVILKDMRMSAKDKITVKDYRWIKNSNDLIVLGLINGNVVNFNSYDVKNEVTRECGQNIDYGKKQLTFKNININSIDDVDENIDNNVVCIKAGNKNNKNQFILWSSFWRWSVLKEGDFKIGKLKSLYASNQILYENLTQKTINKVNFQSEEILCEGNFIGLDKKNNMFYYDKDTDGKITEIKVKGLEAKEDKTYNMDKGVLAQDITVLGDGNVFVNDKEEHKITAIINKETISYDGELLDIKEDCIISNDNGKIMVTYIK